MRKIYINGEPISYYLSNKKRIDSELSQIKPGSIKWGKLVKVTAILLFTTSDMIFANGLGAMGSRLYGYLLDIAQWYAILGCGLELIKHGLNGTTNQIGKTVISYILMYAAIYKLPWLLEVIKEVLK